MLKDRIRAREPLVGTFLKTPHYGVVEALGGTGLDFVILDGEHAGFGLAQMDACVLAARAVGLPCLARITSCTPADILRVLDLGADGIFVPHVMTGEQAAAIAKAACSPDCSTVASDRRLHHSLYSDLCQEGHNDEN